MDASDIRIMIVEDDELEREALAALLAGRGYRISQAANGLEALMQLRASGGTDLIVLDMAMPVMDGWRFLAEKMKDPVLMPIKVIVLSGYEFPAPQLFSSLVEAFLRKPLELDTLLGTIQRIAAESAAASNKTWLS
jgi:CheY-like chemotaxis protein